MDAVAFEKAHGEFMAAVERHAEIMLECDALRDEHVRRAAPFFSGAVFLIFGGAKKVMAAWEAKLDESAKCRGAMHAARDRMAVIAKRKETPCQ